MKITDVRAGMLSRKTDHGGYRPWCLAQVIADDGTSGIGESFAVSEATAGLIRVLKSVLVGQDCTDVRPLIERMFRTYLYRGGAHAGSMAAALSGVETALWDLAGKVMGISAHKLLGGKFRDSIRLYSDFHAGDSYDPSAFADAARQEVARGFTALKFDLDQPMPRMLYERDAFSRSLSNPELRLAERVVGAVREAVGPDVDLAVDCHSFYDVNSAIKLAQALEPFNLLWLEEPVPPDNVAAMAAITAATRTPICTGENLYTAFGFRELLERQAVRLIMPDIQKVGGLHEGKRIADLADLYYVPFAPHVVASPVAAIASAQLCAALPNFLVLEYHMGHLPWWGELIESDSPIVQNGQMAVPTGPGLGITLSRSALREYVMEGDLAL